MAFPAARIQRLQLCGADVQQAAKDSSRRLDLQQLSPRCCPSSYSGGGSHGCSGSSCGMQACCKEVLSGSKAEA